MLRTHHCGELRVNHLGVEVILTGAIDRKTGDGMFLLRDRNGMTLVMVGALAPDEAVAAAKKVRPEAVVRVIGKVNQRVQADRTLKTGAIYIDVSSFQILCKASPIPGGLDEQPIEERIASRPLDLRRPVMQQRLAFRSEFVHALRNGFASLGFLDIETPLLGAWSKESTQSFVVPAGEGKAYALPNVTQAYKQLLMAGGVDRYVQVARCFRREDELTEVRQPEYSILDLEMAFCGEEDLFAAVERVLTHVWEVVVGEPLGDVPRIPYDEALKRYGTDAPDLRFDLEIACVTEALRGTKLPGILAVRERCAYDEGEVAEEDGGGVADAPRGADATAEAGSTGAANDTTNGATGASAATTGDTTNDATAEAGEPEAKLPDPKPGFARALLLKGASEVLDDDSIQAFREAAAPHKAAVTIFSAGDDGTLEGEDLSLLVGGAAAKLAAALKAAPGDWVVVISGRSEEGAARGAGAVRLAAAEQLNLPREGLRFCWVTRFPFYRYVPASFAYAALRHPFTKPVAEHIEWVNDPERCFDVRTHGFDLVLNGVELGAGSLRNHDLDLQRDLLEMFEYPADEVERRWGAILTAFECGVPPHGGMAIGLDRLVAMAQGLTAIHEVIAFPKAPDGSDPLVGAPYPIDPDVAARLAGVPA